MSREEKKLERLPVVGYHWFKQRWLNLHVDPAVPRDEEAAIRPDPKQPISYIGLGVALWEPSQFASASMPVTPRTQVSATCTGIHPRT